MKFYKLVILFMAVALIMSACTKENGNGEKSANSGTNLNEDQEAIDNAIGQKINGLVSNFKVKLNSKLKSDEEMSVDSALWYINTTINETYSNMYNDGEMPGKIQYDSLFINLPENDGTLDMEEITGLYNEVLENSQDVYHQIPEEDKQFATMIIDKTDSETQQIKVTIVTYSTWGLNWWEQFNANELYYWSRTTLSGEPVVPNAMDKLSAKYMRHVIGPALTECCYYWVPDITYPVYDYNLFPYNFNPNNTPPWSNYLDYYMFSSWYNFPGYDEYLCGDELNFSLSKMIYFADTYVPQTYGFNVSKNYRCYYIQVDGAWAFCGPALMENLVCIYHTYVLRYGHRVNSPNPNMDF